MKSITLDTTDFAILAQLQQDASLENRVLAARVHTSAPTCLRRVRRLHEAGLIERQVAVLNPERLAEHVGHGLTAIVEVTLERQDAASVRAFEHAAVADAAVQQCYQVAPGPDFVLMVQVRDMPDYQAWSERLLTAALQVRTVRVFFSVNRSKFGTALPLPA